MKNQILVMTVLTMCIGVGVASAKGRPAGPMSLDRLAQELELTTDQEVDVRAILAEHHEQMRSLRGVGRESTEVQSLRTQTDSQLRSILSDEQFEQFEAHRAQRHANRGRRDHNAETER